MAAALLRAGGGHIDDSAGFMEGVLAALAALPPVDRERVRALVDWVEHYSLAEARFFGAAVRKCRASARADSGSPPARNSAAASSSE